MKNLSIKNVKTLGLAFTADLYDGRNKVAHVSNSGRGGNTRFEPVRGLTLRDMDKYDNSDTELWVAGEVDDWETATKYQGKAICGMKGDELARLTWNGKSIAQVKKMPGGVDSIKRAVAKLEADGYKVINRNLPK